MLATRMDLVTYEFAKLRAYAPFPSLTRALRAYTLINGRLTHFFLVLCYVVSI